MKITINTTLPVFVSAATDVTGTSLVLTYNKPLRAAPPAGASLAAAFPIDNTANGGQLQTITAVTIAGTDVTLTLTPGMVDTDAPMVAYTPAAVVSALRDGSRTLPAEIKGISLGEMLDRMRAVLRKEGSPQLAADLDEHGDWLRAWMTRSTDLDAWLESSMQELSTHG